MSDTKVNRFETMQPRTDGSFFAQLWADELRRYNFILFIIHTVLGFALYIYLRSVINPDDPVKNINLDLFKFVLDPVTNSEGEVVSFEVLSEKARTVSETDIAMLIASFYLITGVFHLLYALNPCDVYLSGIRKANQSLRWIEYSLTATIMLIILAILSGVKDIQTVMLLAVTSIGMIATGQWFETSMGKARWVPIVVGFILLAGILVTIWNAFQDRIKDANDANLNPPAWLWGAVVLTFIFYGIFGLVPIAQMCKNMDYRQVEKIYLFLSLFSKAQLGLFIAFGFSQRVKSTTPS